LCYFHDGYNAGVCLLIVVNVLYSFVTVLLTIGYVIVV